MNAITFLGTGKYQEVTYFVPNENKEYRSKFFAEAIQNIFNPSKMFIFMTDGAEEQFANELERCCNYEKVKIPDGKNENELWKIFEIVCRSIPPNEKLIVDVTHGFRSIPMLSLSIIVFLRNVKNIIIERIIYGAFEAKDFYNGKAPIFDITNFLNIIDWSNATSSFLKQGNSKELKDILRDLHKKLFAINQEALGLKNFGDLVNNITQSLSLIRPEHVSDYSHELPRKLYAVKKDIERYPEVKPLQYLLESIPESFSSLTISDKDIFSPAGFRMQCEMIKFYLETEQYVQAITLTREMLVSLICKENNLLPIKDFHKRSKGEKKLNQWSDFLKRREKIDSTNKDIAELWCKITDVRNDINHAGMRKSTSDAANLITKVTEICNNAIKIVHAHKSLKSSN